MREISLKILITLTAITIIGEIASIILWITNPPIGIEPSARFSLAVDYTIAIANAALFAGINILALFLIIKKNKNGPLILIFASIVNRLISHFIFIGGIHGIFITWTALLVIFAFVQYRGLSNFKIAFLSLGVLSDFALSSLLFSATENADLGLVFYLGVLAVLVGIILAIRKLR
jgi:hypothetical protein